MKVRRKTADRLRRKSRTLPRQMATPSSPDSRVNNRFDLPETGGYGTWMFTIGGWLLLGCSCLHRDPQPQAQERAVKRWLLAAACGAVALGLMFYPLAGELVSDKYHSDVETTYTAAIEDTDAAELTAQREAAEQYNAMLSGTAITEGGASAPPLAYAQQLTVGGVMCYVEIPKIGVYLPVEHGTSADTLEKSVGHVIGTSLPVGGASTTRCCPPTAAWQVPSCFRTLTSLQRATRFTSMCWERRWHIRLMPSIRCCPRTQACCKLRMARI